MSKILVNTSNTPKPIIKSGIFKEGQIVTVEEHKAALKDFYDKKDATNFENVKKAIETAKPYHKINVKGFTVNGSNYPAGLHFTTSHKGCYWNVKLAGGLYVAGFATRAQMFERCRFIELHELEQMSDEELRNITKIARIKVDYKEN